MISGYSSKEKEETISRSGLWREEKFADDLRTISNGRIDIKVFADGELMPASEVPDAVATGVVDLAHSVGVYFSDKIPTI